MLGSASATDIQIRPVEDVIVCPDSDQPVIVTCLASETNIVTWEYVSAVFNTTAMSPDLERIADAFSYRGETIGFVTSSMITGSSVSSQMHVIPFPFLFPITVTCSTNSSSLSRSVLAVGKFTDLLSKMAGAGYSAQFFIAFFFFFFASVRILLGHLEQKTVLSWDTF